MRVHGCICEYREVDSCVVSQLGCVLSIAAYYDVRYATGQRREGEAAVKRGSVGLVRRKVGGWVVGRGVKVNVGDLRCREEEEEHKGRMDATREGSQRNGKGPAVIGGKGRRGERETWRRWLEREVVARTEDDCDVLEEQEGKGRGLLLPPAHHCKQSIFHWLAKSVSANARLCTP